MKLLREFYQIQRKIDMQYFNQIRQILEYIDTNGRNKHVQNNHYIYSEITKENNSFTCKTVGTSCHLLVGNNKTILK